jgi:hypothetical protein
MKHMVFLICFGLLFSCRENSAPSAEKKEEEKPVVDENKKKDQARLLDGTWMSEPYLENIEKSGSIYESREYSTQLWFFGLDKKELLGDKPYLGGGSEHEGGQGNPLIYDAERNLFINDLSSKEHTTFHEPYSLQLLGNNRLEMVFEESGVKDGYRKVVDFDTELRRILLEGVYKNDSLSIEFKRNGSVSGFGEFKHYGLVYDFMEGIFYDAVAFHQEEDDNNWDDSVFYHFKKHGNSLVLSFIHTNWETMEHTISEEEVVLIKQ